MVIDWKDAQVMSTEITYTITSTSIIIQTLCNKINKETNHQIKHMSSLYSGIEESSFFNPSYILLEF